MLNSIFSIYIYNNNNRGKYDVSDTIVLWYALVSLLISWPVGYASGCLLYNIRESLKDKYRI